jgi:hypothetical protein
MGGASSMYAERRRTYRVLVGKTEERIQLGRPSSRWTNNIKINFQEVR